MTVTLTMLLSSNTQLAAVSREYACLFLSLVGEVASRVKYGTYIHTYIPVQTEYTQAHKKGLRDFLTRIIVALYGGLHVTFIPRTTRRYLLNLLSFGVE